MLTSHSDNAAMPRLPLVIMRGGTSKGIFLHARDLPDDPGPGLDSLLLGLMGSPDPAQIDGLGGARSSTSKVIIVAPAGEPGADVDYWFAQVSVDTAAVSWDGNCGNLTSAVGPFAVNEGLVAPHEPMTSVRLRNRNTGVVITSTFGVKASRAETVGDCVVPGVPGTGAPVTTRYLSPSGGIFGVAFPTGSLTDEIVDDDGNFAVSLVDVTHPYAFVRASDVGVDLSTPTEAIDADVELRARLERLRTACALVLGAVTDPSETAVVAPAVPRLILVGSDDTVGADKADIRTVAVSMGRIHHALPITGALCLAAAVAVGSGTVPGSFASCRGGVLTIRHPKGVASVAVETGGAGSELEIEWVGVTSTARRLLVGEADLHELSSQGRSAGDHERELSEPHEADQARARRAAKSNLLRAPRKSA